MRILGTLSDADAGGAAADYTAAIDWGDSTISAGTIGGTGPFTVSGSHTYSALGQYTVRTHSCDFAGSCADATTSMRHHVDGWETGQLEPTEQHPPPTLPSS